MMRSTDETVVTVSMMQQKYEDTNQRWHQGDLAALPHVGDASIAQVL